MQIQRSLLIKYCVIAFVVAVALHHAYSTAAVARETPTLTGASATPTEAQPSPTTVQSTVQQRLMANLTQSGFTDIRILPESFLVQAKDQEGHPVTIFVRSE